MVLEMRYNSGVIWFLNNEHICDSCMILDMFHDEAINDLNN